jgi:Ca2+-transporting ATPase
MEVAFDSERRRMTTVHQADGGIVAFTKGAPEAVVRHCTTMLTGAGPVDIDRAAIMQAADAMAADGLRVLAIATRGFDAPPRDATAEEIEHTLTFLSLVGLLDPPRAEAREGPSQGYRIGRIESRAGQLRKERIWKAVSARVGCDVSCAYG